ncbi:MAG: biotin--[acetyl-CoA-carboxylase] ligase, partial [Planctomycetota bacterium]|nr:biotin--[acetyl-CoA-carboxylase] ligase [Planctomycetota bacterium]
MEHFGFEYVKSVPFFMFYSVGSTNRVAKEFLKWGVNPPFCVLAAAQTEGRGRLERKWESPPYGGVYLSHVCSAEFERVQIATLAAAVAVKEVILHFEPNVNLTIRYPNDVLVNNKKISGILAELVGNSIIIGVGLNLHLNAFSEDLLREATALDELGEPPDRYSIVRVLFEQLDKNLRQLASGGGDRIIEEVERSGAVGCMVKVVEMDGKEVHGVAERI